MGVQGCWWGPASGGHRGCRFDTGSSLPCPGFVLTRQRHFYIHVEYEGECLLCLIKVPANHLILFLAKIHLFLKVSWSLEIAGF